MPPVRSPKKGAAPAAQSEFATAKSSVAETLLHEVLNEESGLTQAKLAKQCGVAPQVISELLGGRQLTSALAMKLDQGTHISAPTWMAIAASDRLAAEVRKQRKKGVMLTSMSPELAAIYETVSDQEFSDDDLGDDWSED